MTQELLKTLLKLRAVVGFLGEQGDAKRWPSAFFAKSSGAFLSPLFPRTINISQLRGVTCAAARVHDERIGVGDVYHLFRLPEELEQALHTIILKPEIGKLFQTLTLHPEAAMQDLSRIADSNIATSIGPTRIGALTDLAGIANWQKVASHYQFGFRNEAEVYPFFSAK